MSKRIIDTVKSQASDTVRRMNPSVFGHPTTTEAHNAPQVGRYEFKPKTGGGKLSFPSFVEEGKRIRQDPKPLLNKLEAEWFEVLKRTNPLARPQALKFRLCNGTVLCPDFADLTCRPVTCWEVKGKHAWEDSLIKLKFAASAWPEVEWRLCWKEEGQWKIQNILP